MDERRPAKITTNGCLNMKEEDEEDDCVNVFGTKEEDEVVDETSSDLLLVAPKEIAEEEAIIKAANEEKAAEEDEETRRLGEEMPAGERYTKLMALLSKSDIYSKYLMDKMTVNDAASALKKKQVEGRRKLKEQQKKKTTKQQTPKRGARRQDDDDDYHDHQPHAKKVRAHLSRTWEGEEIPDEQPLLLSGGIMRDYQIKGYQWISTLFENDINGILADEMGLGKTIQTISLFCHLVEMGVQGPFLIVAPLSTVTNWIKEFNRFAPLMPTVLYHGSKAEREDLRQRKLKESVDVEMAEDSLKIKNVFVTSYEIAMNDRPFLARVPWRFIVVDEGHRLKNMNCRLIRELRQYHSVNKLLLTGTPLQNNLSELWSLLNFIMPDIFDDLRVFESWFDAKQLDENDAESDRILVQEQQNNILSTLHQILTPFLLRRVKSDVDLKIPPKKEVLVYCPMTERQRLLYEAIVSRTISELVRGERTGKVNGGEAEEEEVTGRGSRNKVKIDYSVFLGDDNGEFSEKKLDKYLAQVQELQQNRDAVRRVNGYQHESDRSRGTMDIHVSLKNRLMDMRKATNHPYLIEYPLTEDGVFYDSSQDMIDICGKLKVLDQMLEELLKRDHKVLIFSQMTRVLDILGDYLALKKLKFSRLDGTMHFEDRQANIDRFSEDPDVKLFLLSTRAGGLGINLTVADTCIIYDSDWNPQQDLQAQDRCHRIGQTKPVMVYRLVTANTIDQKIVERAAAKRKLEKMIIHSKKFKSQDSEGLKRTMEAISPQELLDLLNSKDHAGVSDRVNEAIFSEEEMEALLDRSDLTWAKKAKQQQQQNGKKAAAHKERENLFKVIDAEEGNNILLSVKED